MKRNLIFFSFALLVLFMSIGCNPYDKYLVVKNETEINLLVRNQRNERGGTILNDHLLFASNCPLIDSEGKSINHDLNELYFAFSKVPYQLIKEKHSDIFFVLINKDTLRYRLVPIQEKSKIRSTDKTTANNDYQ